MSNKAIYLTIATTVLIAAAVVQFSPSSAQNMSGSIVDTSIAVADAAWADNITITTDSVANTFRFQSNGIPDHGFADQYLIPTDPTDQPFADKPAEFSMLSVQRIILLNRR